MGKYFGTDGVRGIANQELTPELAYKIGRCGGYVIAGQVEKPKVVIGRDTRISGPMLEASLVAGLLSIGADVIRIGIVSTPAVAYLTKLLQADAGVMISASHNPMEDNGIKFFGGDGFKLLDEMELKIEELMDADVDQLPRPVGEAIGTVTVDEQLKYRYIEYLKTTVDTSFSGLKIVLDCANGSAYDLAPRLFREMGAEVITIGAEPDGCNINKGCGSTHPAYLREQVLLHRADVGLSFDGDADRLIAVDDSGFEIDGDYVLSICGDAMNRTGKLSQSTIVTTVMSNIGFFKAVEHHGMQTVKAQVGDRYVMEEMRKGSYNLGGEQSGHVIFLDYSTTGDGILTGLQLVNTIVSSGKKLSQLKEIMRKYPQILNNVKVGNKHNLNGNQTIAEAVQHVESELGGDGRVLVRPSGTESLVRVMVEGPDIAKLEEYVKRISRIVEVELA